MADQLTLPIERLERDRLCESMPISPAQERPGRALVSIWEKDCGRRGIAWCVHPMPEDTPAYAQGNRWGWGASNIYADGSPWGNGGVVPTREEAIRTALRELEYSERRLQRAKSRKRSLR